jgi:hypothetical protein
MKRLLVLGLVCVFSCCLHAQVVDTTVCDILKNPTSFNGKMVRIKGTVEAGFDQFVVKGANCGQKVDDIWLSYPEGSKAKAGPAAMVELQPASNYSGTIAVPQRPSVTLQKDKAFKQFDSLLLAPAKINGMCLGCRRNEVSATLVGRLDGTQAGIQRDPSGKIVSFTGFGNMSLYSARLVLQSVTDVTSKELDYSKGAAASKDDVPPGISHDAEPAPIVDPVTANRKAVAAFGAGTQAGSTLSRAIDAFGKEGDKAGTNGVLIVNGNPNEATDRSEIKGTHDSPDGILYDVELSSNHMEGDAVVRAVAHMGQHVADLRSPEKGYEEAGLYELEFRAWNTTLLSVTAYGQKTLTLPGGEVLWNSAWPAAEQSSSVNNALKDFLTTQELLSR